MIIKFIKRIFKRYQTNKLRLKKNFKIKNICIVFGRESDLSVEFNCKEVKYFLQLNGCVVKLFVRKSKCSKTVLVKKIDTKSPMGHVHYLYDLISHLTISDMNSNNLSKLVNYILEQGG